MGRGMFGRGMGKYKASKLFPGQFFDGCEFNFSMIEVYPLNGFEIG
jgi:hypothetical protein